MWPCTFSDLGDPLTNDVFVVSVMHFTNCWYCVVVQIKRMGEAISDAQGGAGRYVCVSVVVAVRVVTEKLNLRILLLLILIIHTTLDI